MQSFNRIIILCFLIASLLSTGLLFSDFFVTMTYLEYLLLLYRNI